MHNHELGDHIGAESCLEFGPDVANIISHGGGAGNNRPRPHRRSGAVEKNHKYPPTIPSLASTENPPWVMKKYTTSDRRLVIRKEKVRSHEYFQAHRSNGRLVLNLMPLDAATDESCKEQSAGGVEKFNFRENVAVPGKERISESSKYNGIGVKP